MQNFNCIDEILDFAIREEEQAELFYRNLAGKMNIEPIFRD